jgi:hypothetical protein
MLSLLAAVALAQDPPPPSDFALWFAGFQQAVRDRDAEAIGERTLFPFVSWDLVGKVPGDTTEGGPVALDHDGFVAHWKALFDREARRRVAAGKYTWRPDAEVFSLEIWSRPTSYTWLDFGKLDDGSWKLLRTDNVSE